MKDIDHVAIKVENIENSVRFYVDNFDAEVISKYEDWAFLRFGNIKMALIASDKHPVHIAFSVDSREDLDKFEEKVYDHRDGTSSCYTKDPDGNFVEYIFYKK